MDEPLSYAGRTVAVVGASSGIGRGFSLRAAGAGASVVAAARRKDLLDALIAEAGGGQAEVCDLADADAGARLADAIRPHTDHLDALIISAGAAPLRRMALTEPDDWRQAFETNVVGINRLIAGVFDLLRPETVIMVVSSEVAVAPRSHLGAYGASKAALEHSVEQWREEHPWLRLTTVSLGATMPTDFGREFDPDTIVEALDAWAASGRSQMAFMDTEQVCDVLVDVVETLLGAPTVGLPRLVLRSPSPGGADAGTVMHLAGESGAN